MLKKIDHAINHQSGYFRAPLGFAGAVWMIIDGFGDGRDFFIERDDQLVALKRRILTSLKLTAENPLPAYFR